MKNHLLFLLRVLTLITGLLFLFQEKGSAQSYDLENLVFPEDMPPEAGDLAFDSEGRLYLALRRGDIIVAKPHPDPGKMKWRVFATGLHNPVGMEVLAPAHIVVSQMAELTEIKDTNGDGLADSCKNLSNAWGVSGNYHETNAICLDGLGGYYIAVGTASHNGPTFSTPRGEYSKEGRRGRNFSAVSYRGYVLHYDKNGRLTPFANGFRMHNGIARAPDGTLWCGDNQGDWRGASPLYHVRKDCFAGHPSSLVWDQRFKEFGAPIFLPRRMLDDLYNKPALMMPRNMMNSCGEPFIIESDHFGPFKGQMLIPDENGRRIVRAMIEKVDGAWQGAATLFFHGPRLRSGGMRMTMDAAGKSLYLGSTTRGWQKPDEGVQRITYRGKIPFAVRDCRLTNSGFSVSFTRPIEELSELASGLKVRSFRYEYGYRYGSQQKDIQDHKVLQVRDQDPYEIVISDLKPGRVYELKMEVRSKTGQSLDFPIIQYTLNRLKRPKSDLLATLHECKEGLEVRIGGKFFTRVNLHDSRKYALWPVQGPGDLRMLRDWPLKKDTPGEAHDHPHHKGIFIGHENLSGANFWHEGKKNCGKIETIRLIETRSGQDRALVKTLNAWKNAAGKVIGADTRTLTFWGDKNKRFLDLEITLHATRSDLVFHEKKDAFLALRTHPDLRLSPDPKHKVLKVHGQAISSEGIAGKDVWGKRADWLHYYGKIEGKPAGIIFMSHPSNPSHNKKKMWWHARHYGLIAANPFAPSKLGGDGKKIVEKGQSLQLRYRLVFHNLPEKEVKSGEFFTEYASDPGHPISLMPPHPGYPEDY